MLYFSSSARHTWPSGSAARLACHGILAPARQLTTASMLPAPTASWVRPLWSPRGCVAMPRAHCTDSIAQRHLRGRLLHQDRHSCRWPSEERRREDVAAVREPSTIAVPTPAGEDAAICTPLHASRGRRDVSGLVQLAAYHHETGIRSACTKRDNPSGLTAAGSTAHLRPNADDAVE